MKSLHNNFNVIMMYGWRHISRIISTWVYTFTFFSLIINELSCDYPAAIVTKRIRFNQDHTQYITYDTVQ